MLRNDLAKAGLGAPTEHFQGPSIPVGAAGTYVEDVVRASGPIFGTKIAWEQSFALPEVPYDAGAITEIMQQLLLEDYLWERYLGAVQWNALTVYYEDFVEDRTGWSRRIGEHIGYRLGDDLTVDDSLRPMADAWTDELERRLDRELAAPSHPFWTSPSLQWTVPASLPKERCVPLA